MLCLSVIVHSENDLTKNNFTVKPRVRVKYKQYPEKENSIWDTKY